MSGPSDDGSGQPHLHSTRSFTRMDSSDVSPPASVKQTADESVNASSQPPSTSPDGAKQENGPDVFERRGSADSGGAGEGQGDEGFVLSRSVQDPSEELPIELVSLTDR
jgi:hypothetical protein